VLQCFSGRWSLSGIYLQQARQKINKFLVWALQVVPQRRFLWDQILQLICHLFFLAGNGIGKISTQCCMKIAQRTNN
jgi:hypothetical protein